MALINLRNALMTGKRLPYDAEVEFLESTGTQWIDTGIVPSLNTRIEATVQALASPTIVSTGATSYGVIGITYWNSPLSWATKFGNVGYKPAQGVASISTSVIYKLSLDKSNFTVNGTVYPVNATSVSASSSLRILYDVWNTGLDARVFNLKIYESAVLVRDFIPVRKGSVGYLYDRVTGKLLGNSGTGDFVLGPDVVPVEYILQTGTQYIDTLYPMADTRREVITVDWSGHSTTHREFMAGAASGSYLIELSANGYYGTAPTNLSSIQVSQKDRIRWNYTVGRTPSLYINDVFAINDTLIRVPTGNVKTGGVGTPGQNFPKTKIYGLDIFTDADEQVRKMLPVRVGTDATSWEGAMMDVLTRRIYRNAGTGAFGYGNDLKYPIPA